MLETSTTEIIILSILGIVILSRIIASLRSEEVKSDKLEKLKKQEQKNNQALGASANTGNAFNVKPNFSNHPRSEVKIEEPTEQKPYNDSALEAIEDEKLRGKVFKLTDEFKGFMPVGFIDGARTAFEFISKAFGELNRKDLEPLLAKNVYSLFDKEIKGKEGKESYEVNLLVGIKEAVITDMRKTGNKVRLTVDFVTEQIKSLYNVDEKKYSNASNILKINETWEFEKDMHSSSPVWTVVNT